MSQFSFAQTEDVSITFEFDNGEIITQNSEEYYAFDIMAYASQEDTYFGSGMIYFNYDTSAFGSNVFSADNIIVEKGDLILGELAPGVPKYEIINITDNSPNRIAITTDYYFPQLPEQANILTTNPIQYLHIKLKVEDISAYSGLSFEDNLMGNQQYQSDNSTHYVPVIATDTDNTDLPVAQNEEKLKDFSDSFLLSHPNPFDSNVTQTELKMLIPKTGNIELKVYNIKGQFVSNLYQNFHQKKSVVNCSWEGTNSRGKKLSSGIYLFQLLVDNKLFDSTKILIMR